MSTFCFDICLRGLVFVVALGVVPLHLPTWLVILLGFCLVWGIWRGAVIVELTTPLTWFFFPVILTKLRDLSKKKKVALSLSRKRHSSL